MSFSYTSPQSQGFFPTSRFTEELSRIGQMKELGLTFAKDYKSNQSDLDADFAIGSETATFTASRGATTPATTIETQKGNALLFDGVDDKADVPNTTDMQIYLLSSFSVTVKARASDLVTSDSYIVKGKQVVGHLMQFSDGNGNIVVQVYNDTTNAVAKTNGAPISVDSDHTITYTYNEDGDNKIKIYVDGSLQSLATDTAGVGDVTDDSASARTFTIGSRSDGANTLEGQVKDVQFHNTALSSSQVSTIHNGGSVTTNLVAHWDFSDGSGSTLTDIVGSNNGTITGAKWLVNGNTYVTKVTADDTARWTTGYYDSSGFTSAPGLLLEGASTNLIKDTTFHRDTAGKATSWDDIDATVAGTITYSVIEEIVTNISGSRAQRLQYTGVAGDNGTPDINFQNQVSTAAGSVTVGEKVTVSAWLKGSSSGLQRLVFRLNERTSANSNISAQDSSDMQSDISNTEWRRFSYTFTAAEATVDRVRIAIGFDNFAEGDSIDINIVGFQLEQAAYPSSFIPTTTAALTRNAETLTYLTADNFVGGTDGSIALVYRPIMLPDEQGSDFKRIIDISIDNDNGWVIDYDSNSNDKIRLRLESGASAVGITSSSQPFSSNRHSLHSWIPTFSITADGSGNKINLYLDGSVDGTSSSYTVPVGSLPTNIFIQNGTNQAMILVGVALFNKRLNATEASQTHGLLTN